MELALSIVILSVICHPERSEGSELSMRYRFFAALRMTKAALRMTKAALRMTKAALRMTKMIFVPYSYINKSTLHFPFSMLSLAKI